METMERINMRIVDATRNPNTNYLTDAYNEFNKAKANLAELNQRVNPMTLSFLNTIVVYTNPKRITERKPINDVLLELKKGGGSGYIDVMQDYIELLRGKHESLRYIENIVEKLRELNGQNLSKSELLAKLSPDVFPFSNIIADAGEINASILRKLIKKIHEFLTTSSGLSDIVVSELSAIVVNLNETIIPILRVLTDLNETPEGHAFIQKLNLFSLIKLIEDIAMQKHKIKYHSDRAQYYERDKARMIGDFGTKFVPKRPVDEQAFVKSGNASQSVIGDSTFSAKGGRRTRRHKKRSAHKRSGHKRSGKRSGRKSRRR
jgi:hypothetical protein